eukprot:CAMPEP_0173179322 /NCGR_PEP_ID=MMETSP1141-20130122/6045_1 /TAXON_ID=483371 /ORGANISM="non described non described, Strain CCMP2298" /LENGTH=163 /DNA_ID=CAMNT_0014101947 /DNA_START=416 /DNA_END=907 /DNA_ORIENTATION=+
MFFLLSSSRGLGSIHTPTSRGSKWAGQSSSCSSAKNTGMQPSSTSCTMLCLVGQSPDGSRQNTDCDFWDRATSTDVPTGEGIHSPVVALQDLHSGDPSHWALSIVRRDIWWEWSSPWHAATREVLVWLAISPRYTSGYTTKAAKGVLCTLCTTASVYRGVIEK